MSRTNPAQFVRQVRQEIKRITWATKKRLPWHHYYCTNNGNSSVFIFFLVDLLLSNIVGFVLSLGSLKNSFR